MAFLWVRLIEDSLKVLEGLWVLGAGAGGGLGGKSRYGLRARELPLLSS